MCSRKRYQTIFNMERICLPQNEIQIGFPSEREKNSTRFLPTHINELSLRHFNRKNKDPIRPIDQKSATDWSRERDNKKISTP